MLFFSETTGVPFEVFGPLHLFLLFFVLCGVLLIYCFRKPLRKFKYNNQLRYIFAGILFTNMTVYYISLAMMGYYDVRKHLPLEFCFITGYLFMYILVTQNRKLYRVIYFFTITSAAYTHLRAYETGRKLVCSLLLEKKKIYLTRTILPP